VAGKLAGLDLGAIRQWDPCGKASPDAMEAESAVSIEKIHFHPIEPFDSLSALSEHSKLLASFYLKMRCLFYDKMAGCRQEV
jgi:hypothetical protein